MNKKVPLEAIRGHYNVILFSVERHFQCYLGELDRFKGGNDTQRSPLTQVRKSYVVGGALAPLSNNCCFNAEEYFLACILECKFTELFASKGHARFTRRVTFHGTMNDVSAPLR